MPEHIRRFFRGLPAPLPKASQKKSKSGIKTPQGEIDLIRSRLKRLKEQLQ